MGLTIRSSGGEQKRGEVLVLAPGISLGEDADGHMVIGVASDPTGGGGTGLTAVCVEVAMHAEGSGDLEILDVPAGLIEINIRNRQWFNATSFSQVRAVGEVLVAGSPGTLFIPQYSYDGGATWSFFDGASNPTLSAATVGTLKSPSVTLTPTARADIMLRWCTYGGDGAQTIRVGKMALQFTSGLDGGGGGGGDNGGDGSTPTGEMLNAWAWHRADLYDGTTATLGSIWYDLTGNQHHLSQIGDGALPTLSGTPANSIATTRFDGSTALQWPPGLYDGKTGGEGFVVFTQPTSPINVEDDFTGGDVADIDGRVVGGATWKHLAKPSTQTYTAGWFAIESGKLVAKHAPTFGVGYGTAGAGAFYALDGGFPDTDQGIEVTLTRVAQDSAQEPSGMWQPNLMLTLNMDPTATAGDFGAGSSLGMYQFFVHMEETYDYDTTVPPDPTISGFSYNYTTLDVGTGTISGHLGISQDPLIDGLVVPKAWDSVTFAVERVGTRLRAYVNGLIVEDIEIPSGKILSGGQPGFVMWDFMEALRVTRVRAYQPGAGFWRVSSADQAALLADTLGDNFGSTTAHNMGASTHDLSTGFHLWNSWSGLTDWGAKLDYDQTISEANAVGFAHGSLVDAGALLGYDYQDLDNLLVPYTTLRWTQVLGADTIEVSADIMDHKTPRAGVGRYYLNGFEGDDYEVLGTMQCISLGDVSATSYASIRARCSGTVTTSIPDPVVACDVNDKLPHASKLRLWHMSTCGSFTYVSGTTYNINSLTDLSGNGWTLGGGSVNRPYINDENTLNGRRVVVQGADYLTWDPAAFAGLSNPEFFILVKGQGGDPNPTWNYWYSWKMGSATSGGANNNGLPIWAGDGGTGPGHIWEDFGSTTLHDLGNPTPALDQWHIYSVRAGSGVYEARLDGTTFYSSGTNTVGFSSAPQFGGFGNNSNLLVGEIAVFDGLTSAERADVINAISARWALGVVVGGGSAVTVGDNCYELRVFNTGTIQVLSITDGAETVLGATTTTFWNSIPMRLRLAVSGSTVSAWYNEQTGTRGEKLVWSGTNTAHPTGPPGIALYDTTPFDGKDYYLENIVVDAGVGPLFGSSQFIGTYGKLDVAEIILYDRVLTQAERDQVTAILNTRWALGLDIATVDPTPLPPPGEPLPPIAGSRSLAGSIQYNHVLSVPPWNGVYGGTLWPPKDVEAQLAYCAANNIRVFSYMLGNAQMQTNHIFDYNLCIANLQQYAPYASIIKSYYDAGVVTGVITADDISLESRWGPGGIPTISLEGLAHEIKNILGFPIRCYLRAAPTFLAGRHYDWVWTDGAVAQYIGPIHGRKESVQQYLATEKASATQQRLRIVGGCNLPNGGDGSSGIVGTGQSGPSNDGWWYMSATDIRRDGGGMAQEIVTGGQLEPMLICWLHDWPTKDDLPYLRRTDIRAAWEYVAGILNG